MERNPTGTNNAFKIPQLFVPEFLSLLCTFQSNPSITHSNSSCTHSLSFPGLVSSLCSAVAVSPSRSAELHLHQCDHFTSFSFSTTSPAGHQKDPTNYRPMPRSLNLTTTVFQSRIGFHEGAHYYSLRVWPFPSHGIGSRSVLMQSSLQNLLLISTERHNETFLV